MPEIPTEEMMIHLQDNETEIKAWEMIREGFAILVKHPDSRGLRIRLMQAEAKIRDRKGLSVVIKKALAERGLE